MKQEMEREPRPGNAKLKVSSLAFSEIPNQSRLFTRFQQDPLSLKGFYPNAAASLADVVSFIPTVLANYTTGRDELCDALVETNTHARAGKKTFVNIESLRQPDTVAVVTGQQAGLFTGPIYTIYKALSAIKMSEVLNRQGIKAVPVFWAATEDHDFDEVSSASFINRAGGQFVTTYTPKSYTPASPVGSVKLDGGIGETLMELFAALPHTEFSDQLRVSLSDVWSDGAHFGDAFLRTLSSLLEKFGMIFLDPMNERLKRLAASIYAKAISRSDSLTAGLIERGDQLEAGGFHAQVHVEKEYFPLFMIDDTGRRAALRKTAGDSFRVKGQKREFKRAQLEVLAANEPERFSPGVMLRPVVQDYLLPTVCYFGGAAETAYFAQNSEVYAKLNRPATPILHRQSFTVIEAGHGRFLEQFDLTLADFFPGPEALLLRLARNSFGADTQRLFELGEKRIKVELDRLDQVVSQIDPTLGENLDTRRRKIIYHIAALRKKALLARARQDETFERRFNRAFAALMPAGTLQERSINVFTYLNKFGPNFIDWIYDAIDLDDKGHRIVHL